MAGSGHKLYQVLLLHRTEGSFAGGFYAFAGGKVENQDHALDETNYLKIAAIRELFEETNLLLATGVNTALQKLNDASVTALRDEYELDYKDNFSGFCTKYGLKPQVEKLFAYRRVGTPYDFKPNYDTQFYAYLCDDDQ